MIPAAHAARDPHTIACMEVWGGQEGFSGSVSVPGHDVFVSCDPWMGHSHGGDVYYVSNCAAGLITRFVLADVAGHGEEVAAAARRLRDLMRRHINTADQRRFVKALGKAFGDADEDGRFATAILLSYCSDTDQVIVCNAGHPRPLYFDAAAHRWTLLDARKPGAIAEGRAAPSGPANLPLGIIDPTEYEQFAIRLGRGDLLVLYSDALIEASGAGQRLLGEAGLLRLAQGLDPSRPDLFCQALHRAAAAGSERLDDDTTIMVLHHNASDPPRQRLGDLVKSYARALVHG